MSVWKKKKPCHEVELALDARDRGVLAADELERIEAHLATCIHCQRHARLLERMRLAARAQLDHAIERTDFPRLRVRVLERAAAWDGASRIWLPLLFGSLLVALVFQILAGSTWLSALFASGFLLVAFRLTRPYRYQWALGAVGNSRRSVLAGREWEEWARALLILVYVPFFLAGVGAIVLAFVELPGELSALPFDRLRLFALGSLLLYPATRTVIRHLWRRWREFLEPD